MLTGRLVLTLAALVCVLTLVGAGCGSDDGEHTTSAAETTSASEPSADTGDNAAEAEVVEQPGKLGDTFEVAGQGFTLQGKPTEIGLDVGVRDLEDPAETDLSPDDIQPGARWVRVTAELRNRAEDPFDTVLAQWELLDSEGQRVLGNDVQPVGPEPQLTGILLPGDRQTGAVVFLLDKGAAPREVRFSAVPGTTPVRWAAP